MAAGGDEIGRAVSAHYTTVDLGAAILAAIRERGGDPERPTFEDLAPFDHFHNGGHPATLALLRLADPPRGARVLDVGGGIGGPARTLAHDLGCQVTVLDATPAFCEVGAMLTARVGLGDRVAFRHGSAVAMPFADGSFDLVWMQNVGMNIAEKGRLYTEIARVLKPGGRFALQEVLAGAAQPAHYPMPWAATAGESFLLTAEGLRDALATAGLREVGRQETANLPSTPGASTALLSGLLWGPAAQEIAENYRRDTAEGCVTGVMVIAERG